MILHHLTSLEKNGRITAFYTDKSNVSWPCNEPEKNNDYNELKAILKLELIDIARVPQTHSSRVIEITPREKGYGITQIAPTGIDGMITRLPNILLCTVEADCVPLYLYDPVKNAIGMVHSGRKGSAELIGVNALEMMMDRYKTKASDVILAFGPCICKNCYEVSDDVLPEFKENFTQEEINSFTVHRCENKYLLDLKKAITISFMRKGVLAENIIDDTPCTLETSSLCSYRRDHGKDRMLTAIMLK